MGGMNGKKVEVGIPIKKPIKFVFAWANGAYLGKLGPDTNPAVASAISHANITNAAVANGLIEQIKQNKTLAHNVFNTTHKKVVKNSKVPAGSTPKGDTDSNEMLEVEI
jgi:hypothetical protein